MSGTTAQRHEVPPREAWPEPKSATTAGSALTDLIIATFRLNGRLMETAQGMAAEGGLTTAWWQVIGGVQQLTTVLESEATS